MSEEPRDAVPASGAMWFPDEGGIVWRGQACLPDWYVFMHKDIQKAKANALREAARDWGDGIEGFPYSWLLDRAGEIDGRAHE